MACEANVSLLATTIDECQSKRWPIHSSNRIYDVEHVRLLLFDCAEKLLQGVPEETMEVYDICKLKALIIVRLTYASEEHSKSLS